MSDPLGTRSQITATLTATGSTQIAVNNIIYMNGTTDYLELYGFINGSVILFLLLLLQHHNFQLV
jgi:hypothetical protein